MKTVNVALIGYAFMGKAHSNAYRQVKAFFDSRVQPEMKVICGRNEQRVREAANRYGWEEYETDWRRVIERKDIDVVDVSTPGDTHAEISIAAAEAGKVVLCEKPLANTLSDAERMYEAVQESRVVHMICHNYRKAPAVILAKQLLEEGRLGDVYHYRGTYLQDWPADPEFPLIWRFQKEIAGSGALGDILSHSLDLARHLVGEISEVSGELKNFIPERPIPGSGGEKGKVTVDDAAATLVRFENGAMGTIEATRVALGRKNYNRFEINGSRGSVAFDLERMNELEVYLQDDAPEVRGFHTINVTEAPAHPYAKYWWPAGHIIGYEHTFTHIVHELMEGIADASVPSPNFEDGLRNQQALDAIERSARTRKWEKVAK